MTWYAKYWTNIPSMSTCESLTHDSNKTIASHTKELFTVNLAECNDSSDPKRQVNYTEQVQIFVTLTTTNRGEIEIYLYSPSNTTTQILPVRRNENLIALVLRYFI